MTVLEIGGLIVILAVAPLDALHAPAPVTASTSYGSIMGAVVIAFFAFIGFEDMVNFAEEVQDSERTMPRAIIATLATMNGALVLLIMASRVFYGLARQGSLPSALAQVWPVTGTPVHATLLAAGLVLAWVLFFPIERLAQASALLTLAIFAGVNVALGVIKKRQPLGPDRFRVPGWWPWIAALAATGVMIGEALRLLG